MKFTVFTLPDGAFLRGLFILAVAIPGLSLNCLCQVPNAGEGQLPGRSIMEMSLILQDGSSLRYTVSIPGLRPSRSYPLVYALHYGGEVTPYYGRGFLELLVEPAFEKLNAIAIAPDCPGRGWTDPVSERAVIELLDFTIRTWPVDTTRVVLTGFSMGGIGCWHYAFKYPGRFSAIIPVASKPPADIELSLPAYIIHGMNDELFPAGETEQIVQSIRERGGHVELVMLKDISHYQTKAYLKPLKGSVNWLRQVWKRKG